MRRKLVKLGKVVLVFVVVLGAIDAALWIVWGRALDRKMAELHARGEPVVVADTIPKPVPEDENAAPLYEQASKSLRASERASRGGDPVFDFYSEDTSEDKGARLQKMQRFVSRNQRVLEIVRQALARPKCVFAADWRAEAEIGPAHLWRMSSLARFSGTGAAVVEATNGHADRATDDIVLTLRLAKAISRDGSPGCFGEMSRGCDSAVTGIREATKSVALSTEQARRIDAELANIPISEVFLRDLRGQRVPAITTFSQIISDPDILVPCALRSGTPSPLEFWGAHAYVFLGRPFIYKDQLNLLQRWDEMVDLAPLSYRKAAPQLREIEQNTPFYAWISRICVNQQVRQWMGRDNLIAAINAHRIALGIIAYKSRFGTYPPNLAELKSRTGWQIPEDPYSGRSLVYHRTGKGFTVYSIGEDLKDDGGLDERDFNRRGVYDRGDLVWEWTG